LLDSDGVRVEVLQRDVREERDLVVLVELNVDVVLARSLLLRGHFVRNCDVSLFYGKFVLLHSFYAFNGKVPEF